MLVVSLVQLAFSGRYCRCR